MYRWTVSIDMTTFISLFIQCGDRWLSINWITIEIESIWTLNQVFDFDVDCHPESSSLVTHERNRSQIFNTSLLAQQQNPPKIWYAMGYNAFFFLVVSS